MTTRLIILQAGLIAVTSAAPSLGADVPDAMVAAGYLRTCDGYGAGFFVIPGTDACLRIGGFARTDYIVNSSPGARANNNPTIPGNQILGNSYYDQFSSTSARLTLNVDVRSSTEYGLLRAFAQFSAYRGAWSGAIHSQAMTNSGSGQSPRASAINVERALIQLGGLTAGFSASFFNFYQGDLQLSGNFAATARSTTVLAYTASLGSGLSAAVSLEDSMYRRYSNGDTWYGMAAPSGALMTSSLQRPLSGLGGLTYAGQLLPDIVASLRIDQNWGSGQIMGALHQLRDFGYSGIVNVPTTRAADRIGWAMGAGLRLNLDTISRGDVLWLQGTYADGALDYAFGVANQGGDRDGIFGAATLGAVNGLTSLLRDGIVNTTLATPRIETSKAWSLAAGFRHFWTPAIRSAAFGSYTAIDQPSASPSLNDARYWTIGTNTIWSPVRNLDLGIEVVYHEVRARTQAGGLPLVNPSRTYRGQEGVWVSTLRIQRNF